MERPFGLTQDLVEQTYIITHLPAPVNHKKNPTNLSGLFNIIKRSNLWSFVTLALWVGPLSFANDK
jgi:hypothetical protein